MFCLQAEDVIRDLVRSRVLGDVYKRQPASSTARASLRIPAGTAPTSPNAGDVWVAGTVIKFYDGTTTKELAFV